MIEKSNNALCYLKSVAFKITYQCNLNCVMCGQAKLYKKNVKNMKECYLELNSLKSVIDQIVEYEPQVYIWGGEPFMYPHIIPIIEYLNYKKLKTFITTNGILLEKYIPTLVGEAVTEITISLDGPKEIHEKIRGKKNIYDIITNNLRLLKEYKQKEKKVFPLVDINIVILKENYHVLYEFVRILNKEKLCRRIRLQLPMFFTKEMADDFNSYVKSTFCNSDNNSFYDFVDDYSSIDQQLLKENLDLIKREFNNVTMFPANVEPDLWFSKPQYLFNSRCLTPYQRINIEPNGDVVACTDFPETVCGNVLEIPLAEIYNNDIFNKHRIYAINNLAGVCARCSHLYLYGE